jgi:hypothetical protein
LEKLATCRKELKGDKFMGRFMRFYTYGLLGAIGGLFSWQLSNILGLSFTQNIFLSEMIVGALMGLLIGFFIGLAEGVVGQNILFALRKSMLSALFGAIGGGVALPLAEGVFLFAGGQAWIRPIGWGLFGLLTGLATGITGGAQLWKGGLGGLLGGLFGGALLELSRQLLNDTFIGKGAGLILLGTAVGVFIALIVFFLSRVWFEVVSGKLKGMEFILDKFLPESGPAAYIGNSPMKSDIVFTDPLLAAQHAILKGHGSYFTLKDISLEGTFINNKKVEEARLANGQRIRMGKTEFVYHEKR